MAAVLPLIDLLVTGKLQLARILSILLKNKLLGSIPTDALINIAYWIVT